jgi:hypothetical protein
MTQTLPRTKAILLVLAFLVAALGSGATALPVTGGSTGQANPASPADLISLADFTRQVQNGNAAQVVGIYVDSVMAFPVVAQPGGQPGYVSTQEGVVTRFSMADAYGSLGFLAHNYLAGNAFFGLGGGQIVIVVFGDGHYAGYRIEAIRHFQATNPLSPYSSFIDQETGATLSANDLFFQTYGIPDHLILQTCIAANGNDSWGRLFVIATPVDAAELAETLAGNPHRWWKYE